MPYSFSLYLWQWHHRYTTAPTPPPRAFVPKVVALEVDLSTDNHHKALFQSMNFKVASELRFSNCQEATSIYLGKVSH